MYCLDADTGKTIWKYKYGRNAKGSPVWADGKIYMSDAASGFQLIQTTRPMASESASSRSAFWRDTAISFESPSTSTY